MINEIKYKLYKILMFIIVFTNINTGIANAENYNTQFNNITIQEGLSQSTVEVLFQDSKGYVWIGTNYGVNRYDGHDFKLYKKGKDSTKSIASNYITDIIEDENGDIWITTIRGVSKINSKTDTITNYFDTKEDGNLSHYNVNDIFMSKDKSILVATGDGINIYNKETDSFERVFNNNELTSQDVYSIDQDEYGNLWIGTINGLNKVDIDTGKVTKFNYNSDDDNTISTNRINDVYCDKNGYVWVGTFGYGLNRIDIESNEITRYKYTIGESDTLVGNTVNDILLDNDKNLWICTERGVSKYLTKENKFINYNNIPTERYSLLNDGTFSIMQDSSGLIWIGSYEGISIYNANNNIQHYKHEINNENSLSSSVVHGVYEDEEGKLWVGTISEGLNVIDRKNNSIEHINEDNGLSNNRVNFIVGDENYIWVATNNGLSRINKKDRSIKNYNEEDGLSEYRIKSLFIDSKGYLWIGTPDGLSVLNIESDEMTDITYILENNNTDKYIQTIYEDKGGNYWLGTFIDGSLIKLDPKSNTTTSYKVESNSIRWIVEDDEYLWLATSYGLDKFNKLTGEIRKYTQEDGLSNDMVYGILVDLDGHLWMSTNYGITEFIKEEEQFINYTFADGLQGNEFNGGAFFQNKNGEMFFGGINGLNVIMPEGISIEESIPKVSFEEFEVKGNVYKDINELNLKYNENEIKIKFFLPEYKDNNKTKYYYKIEGQDTEWNITKNNEVIYKNLSSGKYEFKIMAKNHNGITSEISTIKFTVKPHILLSVPAFLVYIIIGILIIRANINKVKKLDKLVNKRTRQLREEMEKSNKLFDKVLRLEKNKNNYFVNLSHELRTPLNVISTTEQLILALNNKKEGISKEKIDYHTKIMQKNTNRLLNLINNIIDTSKVENGNYTINLKKEDIVYIVEETALGLRDYVEGKGIEFIIDPEIEEMTIECDKYEIERCIVNLISNARKFTPLGGQIIVKIKDLEDKVMISVKDTGVGIEPKYQDAIFDRFNQVIDENSEVKGGSGLGLTITRHIVELHGGQAYVESELGKGSTFTIILPVKVKSIDK
ncbi:MAG: ligand-binding sensor domain-containing protein [Peptostreptococcaceae bacterium]